MRICHSDGMVGCGCVLLAGSADCLNLWNGTHSLVYVCLAAMPPGLTVIGHGAVHLTACSTVPLCSMWTCAYLGSIRGACVAACWLTFLAVGWTLYDLMPIRKTYVESRGWMAASVTVLHIPAWICDASVSWLHVFFRLITVVGSCHTMTIVYLLY